MLKPYMNFSPNNENSVSDRATKYWKIIADLVLSENKVEGKRKIDLKKLHHPSLKTSVCRMRRPNKSRQGEFRHYEGYTRHFSKDPLISARKNYDEEVRLEFKQGLELYKDNKYSIDFRE